MSVDLLVDVGFGAAIAFGTQAFTAQIRDINLEGISLEAFEAGHMGLTEVAANELGNLPKVFSKVVDPGQLTFEMHFNPGLEPLLNGTPETVTLTFKSGTTYVGTAAMVSMSAAIPFNGKMMSNITIEWSGKIDVTAGI